MSNDHQISRKTKGFTLIELMITVAIIAILASIAYPLYTRQVLKSHRAEAKVALNEIALAQERYYSINGSYATQAQLGAAYTDAVNKMTDKDGAAGPDYYTIVMAVDGANNTYSVTATARGSQLEDADCKTFALDQAGARSATDSSDADTDRCW